MLKSMDSLTCRTLLLFLSFLPFTLSAQTVGTVLLTEEALEKITLVNPVNGNSCYAIDNCGFIVKEWNSNYRPGLSSHLDARGNLYRAGRINSNVFKAGGLGGILEKYSWDGELLWQYQLANDSLHLHHDFKLLENGHILLIAWELVPAEELQLTGRQDINSDVPFYSERIIEIDPDQAFEQVWSWRALDHIVQEADPGKPDYALVSENPQRLDINMNRQQGLNYLDWLHVNAIDIHPDYDLLLLSCNAIDELIVIDHSTNTTEANGHAGGEYGKGGDILYRIGNPGNYDPRDNVLQRFFAQHDARWIKRADGTLSFSVFNNGRRAGNINFSSVDHYILGFSAENLKSNIYELMPELEEPAWSYNGDASEGLYSKRMSSARFVEGHWIICSSDEGRFIELDENGRVVWNYVNPVGPNQVFAQGEQPFGNIVFNGPAYPESYFQGGLELVAGMEKIEREGGVDCLDITSATIQQKPEFPEWSFGPGKIRLNGSGTYEAFLYTMQGRRIWSSGYFENDFCSEYLDIPFGVYILECLEFKSGQRHVEKILWSY